MWFLIVSCTRRATLCSLGQTTLQTVPRRREWKITSESFTSRKHWKGTLQVRVVIIISLYNMEVEVYNHICIWKTCVDRRTKASHYHPESNANFIFSRLICKRCLQETVHCLTDIYKRAPDF